MNENTRISDIVENVLCQLRREKEVIKDLTGLRRGIDYGKYCDHTVLRAYTKKSVIKAFCDEAKQYGAAAVCVNPIHVAYVREQLSGTGIKTCAVIGFPLGANKPVVKAFEASEAIKDGAEELDMVMNIGALRDGDQFLVYEDIKAVTETAKGQAAVKVIIETCYLTTEQVVQASILCKLAGANCVKTSTGFGPGGATAEDVELIRKTVGDSMKIKASTNINTRADADIMIKAGADRLGVSRTPNIVTGDESIRCASQDNQPPKRNIQAN